MSEVPDDPGARAALADLERARRGRRLAGVDWFDAFYSAYLTGLGLVIATVVGSTFVPDAPVSASAAERVAADGPALVGLVAAALVVLGLRSGSRGGPLALEAPVVQHVLLAPIDRAATLRGPAARQLRFGAFAGAAAGGVAGLLAARRLPGAAPAYVVAGATAAALTALLALGAAVVASGRRWTTWVADGVAVVALGPSVLDVVAGARLSPATHLGALALWPLRLELLALVGVASVVAVVAIGLAGVGGTSLEAARRRAGLVGELRFAVTMQDMRTVLLLRRQLAQERPRSRPWVRLRPREGAGLPVVRRGGRGLLRFPAVRLARMGALGAGAGLALRGVWSGTTPLLAPAALALFVAALDAIEPLSQDADRPQRWAAFPMAEGSLLVRHLVAPATAMALVGAVGVAAAEVAGPSAVVLELGLAIVPVVAVAAVAGAAASVVMGPPDTLMRVQFPEAAGTSLVFRLAWPPGLVALALVPVLVARSAAQEGLAVVPAALNTEMLVALVLAGVVAWLSRRRVRPR